MSKNIRSQAGFTLVELAIVMIIIGLLIGGVLKGQELINNAQITSTVAQVKGLDAASTSFRDMYNGMAGDLLNPGARLNGCTASAVCAASAGNGNGQVSSAPGAAPGTEADGYFIQLALADLLTGVNPAAAACTAWGQCFPEANIAGGFMIGYTAGAAALTSSLAPAANHRAGHYLSINNAPDAAMPNTGILTANQAARIDTKIDDGDPDSGVVLAAGAAACVDTGVYAEAVTAANCNLYVRIQN